MGKPRQTHEAPEPLEGNNFAVVTGGTALWFVAFLALLPFYGWLDDNDRLWWLWTCLTGGLLGLVGIWDVRRRARAIARTQEGESAGETAGNTAGNTTAESPAKTTAEPAAESPVDNRADPRTTT